MCTMLVLVLQKITIQSGIVRLKQHIVTSEFIYLFISNTVIVMQVYFPVYYKNSSLLMKDLCKSLTKLDK